MIKLTILTCCLLLLVIQIEIAAGRKKYRALKESRIQDEIDSWKLKWFPHAPYLQQSTTAEPHELKLKEEHVAITCDDGQHEIGIDFDPNDKRHSYNYLCLSANRSLYEPNLNRQPILMEHDIPPTYVPPIKCINESITYEQSIPTFGGFRLITPKYGSYLYVPPQRWMRNLAEGAIVLLYHPCAFAGQISLLQNTLKGCLYRYVITPSQALTPERPLALLAWGKCLQMSVVDERIVVNFIKENAKKGPIDPARLLTSLYSYEAGLLSEAHLVTDNEDTEICGYKQMK